MKLAILAQAYLYDSTAPINGTLVQLHNLTYGFKNAGIEVHYICRTQDKTKPKNEIIDGIHFYWLQAVGGVFDWKKLMPVYLDILNEIKPDSIYVRGRNVLQYVAGTYTRKFNVPYVWGTNGDDSAEFWKNVKRLNSSNKNILKKILLLPLKAYEDFYINRGMKLATIIVNQSKSQQRETELRLKKKGVIIPSYFFKSKTNIKKSNTILWLANLSPHKQPNLFVELIKKCELKEWHVVLGGGTKDEKYQHEIDRLIKGTQIKLTGKIEFKDSFKYYESSRIYVNTSKPEADGLPNSYIQSWLSGTVVLSLHHDPNNWMKQYNIGYCANGDMNKLVIKLQELVNNDDELARMSQNSVSFAEKKFSDNEISETYISLFNGKY